MIRKKYCLIIAGIAVALFTMISPPLAHAYLNPGAGSYIFQLAIGMFIGGCYALKIYWTKIRSFAQRVLKDKNHPGDEDK